MGKNPCPICATPETKLVEGRILCAGCGLDISLLRLRGYLRGDKKLVGFDRATRLYEKAQITVSFGEWLVQNNLELVGKP